MAKEAVRCRAGAALGRPARPCPRPCACRPHLVIGHILRGVAHRKDAALLGGVAARVEGDLLSTDGRDGREKGCATGWGRVGVGQGEGASRGTGAGAGNATFPAPPKHTSHMRSRTLKSDSKPVRFFTQSRTYCSEDRGRQRRRVVSAQQRERIVFGIKRQRSSERGTCPASKSALRMLAGCLSRPPRLPPALLPPLTSSCCSGVSKVVLFGNTLAWSDLASQGIIRVT